MGTVQDIQRDRLHIDVPPGDLRPSSTEILYELARTRRSYSLPEPDAVDLHLARTRTDLSRCCVTLARRADVGVWAEYLGLHLRGSKAFGTWTGWEVTLRVARRREISWGARHRTAVA